MAPRPALILLVVVGGGACGNKWRAKPTACSTDPECPVHQVCIEGTCRTAEVDLSQELDLAGVDFGGADLAPASLDLTDAIADLSCALTCADSSEPDDTLAFATNTGPNRKSYSLTLCPAGNVDYFFVRAGITGVQQAVLTKGPCSLNLSMDLLDQAGNLLQIGTATPTGVVAQTNVVINQVIHVRVQGVDLAATNSYVLDLTNQ